VTDRTLVLVKPDGVQRLLAGRIIARFEERGLKIVGLKLMQIDRNFAERHYAVHRDKPFFGGLVAFITSGPLVALALEGPNAIASVRSMVGATRPHEAAPGTIRGDLAVETAQNLVHASDGPETAAAELALWFGPDELLEYGRDVDRWVLAPDEYGGRRPVPGRRSPERRCPRATVSQGDGFPGQGY
jgi:nucleoside-diphosphate kinase